MDNVISCPRCQEKINVSDILYQQVQESLKKEFEAEIDKKEKEFERKLTDLQDLEMQLRADKKALLQQIDEAVKTKLNQEKPKLEEELRKQISDEKSTEVKSLEDQLKNKSQEIKDLYTIKADNSRLKNELVEMTEKIKAEESEKFSLKLIEEREKIRATEDEKHTTEIQKLYKMVDDQKKQLDEAQRKLESGSNKLAGEVKEIELRDFLKGTFPIDEVKDVPSGITGADVVQLVKNNVGQPSGTILYERKQTLSFSKDWIAKLKSDGAKVKADLFVLVTRAMPKENPETHFSDGVWVCTYDDVKIITTLLRDGLIKQYTALASQADKGTKMEMLYSFLLSNDFKNHIISILDAFKKMDRSLTKERDDAMKKFSEREAHILQAKHSIISFWGRVDGIATDSLSTEIKALEISQ